MTRAPDADAQADASVRRTLVRVMGVQVVTLVLLGLMQAHFGR